eukprot:3958089-Prymnesium_polylepis.1
MLTSLVDVDSMGERQEDQPEGTTAEREYQEMLALTEMLEQQTVGHACEVSKTQHARRYRKKEEGHRRPRDPDEDNTPLVAVTKGVVGRVGVEVCGERSQEGCNYAEIDKVVVDALPERVDKALGLIRCVHSVPPIFIALTILIRYPTLR